MFNIKEHYLKQYKKLDLKKMHVTVFLLKNNNNQLRQSHKKKNYVRAFQLKQPFTNLTK